MVLSLLLLSLSLLNDLMDRSPSHNSMHMHILYARSLDETRRSSATRISAPIKSPRARSSIEICARKLPFSLFSRRSNHPVILTLSSRNKSPLFGLHYYSYYPWRRAEQKKKKSLKKKLQQILLYTPPQMHPTRRALPPIETFSLPLE